MAKVNPRQHMIQYKNDPLEQPKTTPNAKMQTLIKTPNIDIIHPDKKATHTQKLFFKIEKLTRRSIDCPSALSRRIHPAISVSFCRDNEDVVTYAHDIP
jgi:hypothetical protein